MIFKNNNNDTIVFLFFERFNLKSALTIKNKTLLIIFKNTWVILGIKIAGDKINENSNLIVCNLKGNYNFHRQKYNRH